MSGWLDDVLGGYLDRVSEREFDAAFLGILAAAGFSNRHFTHGSFEFGKDFIARRGGEQFAFQTKAGDIGLPQWRPVRSQVEEMLWNGIAHPDFDTGAPRRAVLVTTGRLTGGASADAQQYAETLAKRRRRSFKRWLARDRRPPFEVWDRDVMLELLRGETHLTLDGWSADAMREFLGLLADCERQRVSARHIERATRSWGSDLDRAILATALIGNRLSSAGRDDLAAVATFALARTGAVAASDGADPTPSFETSRALFRTYASRLLESIEHCVENPTAFLDLGDEVIPVVGYSVRCSLVVEAAGLLGLLLFDEDTPDDAKKVADLLARFVSSQPGAARPLSDRWAVSLAPAAALLRRCESDALIPWMERVIVWICDRYADGGGLASVAADERREIEQLLGYPLAHLDVKDRRSSYVATVVLDVSCALELPGLFQDAINDFKAVEIARPSLEPLDEPGNFGFDGRGLKFEANVAYDEGNNFDTSWRAGVHHKRCPADYVLQRSGRNWELLAIQALLRDRLFLPAIREAAGLEVPATH